MIDALLLVVLEPPAGITQVAEGPLPTGLPELSKTWNVSADDVVPPVILAWKTVRVTVRETKKNELASLAAPLVPVAVASSDWPLPIHTAVWPSRLLLDQAFSNVTPAGPTGPVAPAGPADRRVLDPGWSLRALRPGDPAGPVDLGDLAVRWRLGVPLPRWAPAVQWRLAVQLAPEVLVVQEIRLGLEDLASH